MATVAKQQGAYVAEVLKARMVGLPPPPPFVYHDQGQLAMVGRSAAVADLGRIKMTGLIGWLLWSVVHLFFLIGARNRFAVYLNWVWAWLTYGPWCPSYHEGRWPNAGCARPSRSAGRSTTRRFLPSDVAEDYLNPRRH